MVSGSISKLSNSTTISDILGAKIMKVQSRLLGYLSGKPGVLTTPQGSVKFLEHSGPAAAGGTGDPVEHFKSVRTCLCTLTNCHSWRGENSAGVAGHRVNSHITRLLITAFVPDESNQAILKR